MGTAWTNGLSRGRLALPGTVHTSVPVKGFSCLTVPSANWVMYSGSRL